MAGGAVAALRTGDHLRAEFAGDARGAVRRAVVDDNRLHRRRDPRQHPRQGGGLVQAWQDDVDHVCDLRDATSP
jgi:hypothetical protein